MAKKEKSKRVSKKTSSPSLFLPSGTHGEKGLRPLKGKVFRDPPIFHPRIFWDVDFEKIDYDAKARFVIERVFERGDVDDIRNCRRYYGDEKITEVLLNAKFLPLTRIYLSSAVINRPINDFRCYTLRQLNPTLYPY